MRQWIRKYSWTPSWTVNMKIIQAIRVTVTFQRTFHPSAGLSYWKIGTRQMCMKWLLIIRHVNSVEQCQTVSTVPTVSTLSTVIARCYLHLRWYFLYSTENLIKNSKNLSPLHFPHGFHNFLFHFQLLCSSDQNSFRFSNFFLILPDSCAVCTEAWRAKNTIGDGGSTAL